LHTPRDQNGKWNEQINGLLWSCNFFYEELFRTILSTFGQGITALAEAFFTLILSTRGRQVDAKSVSTEIIFERPSATTGRRELYPIETLLNLRLFRAHRFLSNFEDGGLEALHGKGEKGG
jgi:hypothetical protein